MKIDFVIEVCLTGIFKEDIFNESLYLKGGQALRLKENLRKRFSADIDFSASSEIKDKDLFFSKIKDSLYQEFLTHDLYLFDFVFTRRPKQRKEGTPDFWGGWEVEFKLIEKSKMGGNIDKLRREAIVPEGVASPKINLDISEHEYCGSVEKIKVRSVDVNVYSRALLLLEKIRAICQQHPDYKLTKNDSRARDYYDVERLWDKVVTRAEQEPFLSECKMHIGKVFAAKGVELSLLDRIFEDEFLEIQESGWPSVRATVSDKVEDFDYYVSVLQDIIRNLK
jgi:predicted nucleotidyltransferase component of viral defense system